MIAVQVEKTFFLTTTKVLIPEDNFMKFSVYAYVVAGFKFVVLFSPFLFTYLFS